MRKAAAACTREFPFPYGKFVRRIEIAVAALSRGVRVVRIDINADDFLVWCAQQKRAPDKRTCAEYAAAISR